MTSAISAPSAPYSPALAGAPDRGPSSSKGHLWADIKAVFGAPGKYLADHPRLRTGLVVVATAVAATAALVFLTAATVYAAPLVVAPAFLAKLAASAGAYAASGIAFIHVTEKIALFASLITGVAAGAFALSAKKL